MIKGKKGFTIVELLMVIGVLSVLVTIITTAASSAVRQSRVKRTAAMMTVLQAGLETYHTQKGEWPGVLQTWAKNGSSGNTKKQTDYLSNSQADTVFRELVRESVKVGRSPMLDVSGLFVSDAPTGGRDDQDGKPCSGLEFMKAIFNGKHHKKIPLSQMAFGYTEKRTGWFRRFIVKYNFQTDSVTVMTQREDINDVPSDYYAEMCHLYSGQNIRWPQKPSL